MALQFTGLKYQLKGTPLSFYLNENNRADKSPPMKMTERTHISSWQSPHVVHCIQFNVPASTQIVIKIFVGIQTPSSEEQGASSTKLEDITIQPMGPADIFCPSNFLTLLKRSKFISNSPTQKYSKVPLTRTHGLFQSNADWTNFKD
jgi:hypothetical protein